MRRRDLFSLGLWLFPWGRLSAATPGAAGSPPSKRPVPLVVVVGDSTPLHALSSSLLRGVFLGDPVKDNAGNKLLPINQPPGSSDRVEFDQTVLRMSPDEAASFWIDRRIRGDGQPPRTCPNIPLLLKLVARFPGALSYVRQDRVPPGVRVVRIDGKLPSDKGYLLA